LLISVDSLYFNVIITHTSILFLFIELLEFAAIFTSAQKASVIPKDRSILFLVDPQYNPSRYPRFLMPLAALREHALVSTVKESN